MLDSRGIQRSIEMWLRPIVRTLRSWPPIVRRRIAARTFDSTDLPEPASCLWSKGIGLLCDFHGPADYWRAPTESIANEDMFRSHYVDAAGLVWLRLGTRSRNGERVDIDHFVSAALPSIRRPFVLITTDGDASVPSELSASSVEALLDCAWLTAWYTQNH